MQPILKLLIARLLSKVQLAPNNSWSCTFRVKSATNIKYQLDLHIYFKKCNSYRISVASCIFLVKSATHMQYTLLLHISYEKVRSNFF
jgi:hypothetical protein